jgi:hypothetical protein
LRKTNNISNVLPVAHSSVSKKQKIKQKKPNAKYSTSTISEHPSRKRMLRKPSTKPNAGPRTSLNYSMVLFFIKKWKAPL